MLADEPFTDRPRAVSPVVSAFLRTYNDLVDDARRQDLYRFASEAVGCGRARELERERESVCRRWLTGRTAQSRRERLSASIGLPARRRAVLAAQAAAFAAASRARHREALALAEALIAAGRDTEDQRLASLTKALSSSEALCS